MAKKSKSESVRLHKNFIAWILVVMGAVALFASFILSIETVEYIKNPTADLSCSINPIVTCTSVIDTPQGNTFGFMNPLLGLVVYSVLIMFGASMLFKAKYPKWVWTVAQLGSLGMLAFVHWLIYTSIYDLGSLCPYCMVTWVASIPIIFYITMKAVDEGVWGKKAKYVSKFLHKYHYSILFVWFAVIITLIINQFGLSNLFA